jgi:hypothetical protein
MNAQLFLVLSSEAPGFIGFCIPCTFLYFALFPHSVVSSLFFLGLFFLSLIFLSLFVLNLASAL